MSENNSRKHLVSTLTVGAGNLVGYALNLVFFLLAARFLLFEDFGIFRYLVSVGMIFYNSLFAGIYTTMTRFLSAEKTPATGSNILCFSTLLLLASLPLMAFLGGVALCLITLSFFISQFVYAYLRGIRAYASLSLYLVGVNAIRIALLGLLYVFSPGIVLFSSIYLAAAVAPLPFILSRADANVFHGPLQKALLKRLIKFSLPLYGSSIAYILVANLDAVFIKQFLSGAELSCYMAAKTLMTVFVFAPFAVSTVILPETARNREIWRNLKFGLVVTAGVSLLLAIPFCLLPELVLGVVYPETYLPAARVLPLLSIAMVLFACSDVFASVWTGAGKPLYEGVVLGIAAVADGLLLYFLLPVMGITGAALALLIAYGTATLLWAGLTAVRSNQ
ncbi:MAG: polysaccharide biosynthesis C-terminal domain-containing protein [Thermoplasmata archaeon]|nr:polysaccharide biosynthesis C-terminal domain-containing protein [Thermoplasmata archaeon]